MHGNSVISFRSAHEAWLTVQASPGIDPDVVHGCVDWYLYPEATLAGCSRTGPVLPEPSAAPVAASEPGSASRS